MYRPLRQPPTTRPRRDRTRWHRAVSSRHDDERLSDIIDAINAIRSHIARGDLSDGLIFGAVRVRLIEIGEAVKALDLKQAKRDGPLLFRTAVVPEGTH